MRRQIRAVFAGAVTAATLGVGASFAVAQADDQARLDAAIDAFEQRMTDAGWVGTPAEEADDEGDAGDVTLGEDEFNECFGELSTVFENVDPDEFPGQTALRESLEFTYLPEGEAPSTTEEFSFELEDEETAAAIAMSVDASGLELLDTFVERIGAKETGDCMREAMEAEMAADTTGEDIPVEFEFDVTNEADLGIGHRSARLQFGFSTNFLGMDLTFDFNMYTVRVDNDLVMLVHGTTGAPETTSGFDPLVELQNLVDSL